MMKKYVLNLLLFFGVIGIAFGQAPDWKWQNPLPTGNNLNDVCFTGETLGWAVGNYGTILRTTDGGENWLSTPCPVTSTLLSVKFVSSIIGWAVGYEGTILKTTDGGNSWDPQFSNYQGRLEDVDFVDAQNGWAVGGGNAGLYILRTTNGGSTWIPQNLQILSYPYDVQFLDAQNGWIVGSQGLALKTTNGGLNWLVMNTGLPNWIFLTAMHFVNPNVGWAVGANGTIIKTTDAGNNWVLQDCGYPYSIENIFFIDSLNGFIGSAPKFLKTTDGGATWFTYASNMEIGLKSIYFIDNQIGYGVSGGGKIIKTVNGGVNWIKQTNATPGNISYLEFKNNLGIAVGGGSGSITTFKTFNSGNTWYSKTSSISPGFFFDATFITELIGFAVGSQGRIFKTIDGGDHWQSMPLSTFKDIYDVQFLDSLNGWAVGDSGVILNTTNGGTNWQIQTQSPLNKLYRIQFMDSQNGWIVGGNPSYASIWKTTNGGISWVTQNFPQSPFLLDVQFVNPLIGWSIGASGTIFKTSDGGLNWINQSISTPFNLIKMHFIDPQKGWIVGDGGGLFSTTDGGNSWEASNKIPTQNSLKAVYVKDNERIWVGGQYSNILTNKGNPDIFQQPVGLIQGKLFNDLLLNCTPTNQVVKNGLVKCLPGPFYAFSNFEGLYNLKIPISNSPSSFSLSSIPFYNIQFQSTPVCPISNQYAINLDTISDTISGKDFGFFTQQCHHLNVQIASNRRRRCFINNTTVSYLNQGVLQAPNAYILVEFPRWVRPVSSNKPHLALNDSTWKFELGTVAAGQGESITIIDSVICGFPEIMNLTQCTKATIYPAPDCPNSPNWTGAEVAVSGLCSNGLVQLAIRNTGTGDMTDSVDYSVLLDSFLVRSGKVKLAAGDSLKLDAHAYGMSVTLSANQVPFHPSNVFVSTTIEACDDTTVYYQRASANHFPKNQTPNSKTQCLPIRDSNDPNDKQAFPIGFTANRIVKPGTELEYLIRFQNTGNDIAYTVYVIDSLDNNLNPETIEPGAVSHPYEISMQTTRQGRTFLRWQFNQINLPDSNTNELRSHGFIQYRISPKAGIPLGTKARNEAAIYFDFNLPVITNQTLTTFDNITFTNPALNPLVQVITSAKSLSAQQIGVKLYPNPVTHNQLNVEFGSRGSLSIFNSQGQLVLEMENLEGKQLLQLNISSGLYWVKMQTINGISIQKLAKR